MGKGAGAGTALAAALQAMDDDRLAAVLRARPDLVSPPPATFTELVTRTNSWRSLQTCLEGLDRFAHQLLNVACLLPDGASATQWSALLGSAVDHDDVVAGIERLRTLALVWGSDDSLRVADVVRQQLDYPARLGQPATALLGHQQRSMVDTIAGRLGLPKAGNKKDAVARVAHALADPDVVMALVARAPAAAASLLREACDYGPAFRLPSGYWWYGSVRQRNPMDWLLAHGLAMLSQWPMAQIPREVGMALRGGKVYAAPEPRRPELATTAVDPVAVERSATAAAETALRAIAGMLQVWGEAPGTALKAGGLGVRELRRVARAVDVSETDAARLLELALAGGLATVADATDMVAPTSRFDEWQGLVPAERWLALVKGWLETARHPSLAGAPDEAGKPFPALAPHAAAAEAHRQRQAVLSLLGQIPVGQTAAPASVAAAAGWELPGPFALGPAPEATLVDWALGEAALLGVTGEGALSRAGRLAVASGTAASGSGSAASGSGSPTAAAAKAAHRAAAAMLAPPSNELTLQADLTCVAPAALDAGVSAELALMADLESTGAATVLRFSEASVRRALDAGRSAEELLAFLVDHAPKGVPQPLRYLVADVARRHGAIRIGRVGSYLRCDDPALVAQVLRTRRAGALGLHQLAPTVVVATVEPPELLAALRAAGFLPAQEAPGGALVLTQPARHRATVRPVPRAPASRRRPTEAEVAKAVAGLRSPPKAAKAATKTAPPAASPASRVAARLADMAKSSPSLWELEEALTAVGDDLEAHDDDDGDVTLLLLAKGTGELVWIAFDDPVAGDGEVLAAVAGVSDTHVHLELHPHGDALEVRRSSIEWVETYDEATEADFA